MSRSLFQQVIYLAWPAVLQGLLSTIILFTDRLILGSYHDAALASMQVSGPVMWSIFSLFGAYSIGVLALIGRYIGAEEPKKAAHVYGTALCIATALGTLVGVLGYVFCPQIVALIIGPNVGQSAATSMAETYMSWTNLKRSYFNGGQRDNSCFSGQR